MKKPLISSVVTNYNGWGLGLLADFFKFYLNNSYKNFEVFLVDMASTDESVSEIQKRFGKDKRLKIIVNPVNNMSAGINMALKQAKGKYVMFLNNDLYFAKGSIEKMVNFMQKHPEAGQVQGKVVSYFDSKKIDSAGETMDIYGNPVTIGAGEEDRGQYDEVREVLSVTGAAALFRTSLIKKFGLLDGDYAIGYEDMDLSLRLRIGGYKMYYLPDVLVRHRRASSTSKADPKLKARIKYWFNKNRLATIVKNYEPINILRSVPFVIVLYIIMGVFEIFYKRLWRFGLARFAAIGWMVINWGELMQKRKLAQRNRKLSDEEAILLFMAKGRLLEGFKGFLGSKKW